MSLELQYFICCRAGLKFTETEFRYMPTLRRLEYLKISQEYHKMNKEEADKVKQS